MHAGVLRRMASASRLGPAVVSRRDARARSADAGSGRTGPALGGRSAEESAATDRGGIAGAELRHAAHRARDALRSHLSTALGLDRRADSAMDAADTAAGPSAVATERCPGPGTLNCAMCLPLQEISISVNRNFGLAPPPPLGRASTELRRGSPKRRRRDGGSPTSAPAQPS